VHIVPLAHLPRNGRSRAEALVVRVGEDVKERQVDFGSACRSLFTRAGQNH
jgi:hypothetical protein